MDIAILLGLIVLSAVISTAEIGFFAVNETKLRALAQNHNSRAKMALQLRSDPQKLVNAPALAREGFVSYYAAPLLSQGKVKGVLEIFHRSLLDPETPMRSCASAERPVVPTKASAHPKNHAPHLTARRTHRPPW